MRFALRLAVNIAILTCLPCLANAGGILIFDLDGNTVDTASALARGADGRLFVAAQSGVSACCNQMKFPILAFDATGSLCGPTEPWCESARGLSRSATPPALCS